VEGRSHELGDTVIADLEGTFGDIERRTIRADDESETGRRGREKAFTENLVGVKQVEEKKCSVSYPADFSSMLSG
jgi:FKBP-type peptidyl-prolyl cis-trans isomerase (trigger factor)